MKLSELGLNLGGLVHVMGSMEMHVGLAFLVMNLPL